MHNTSESIGQNPQPRMVEIPLTTPIEDEQVHSLCELLQQHCPEYIASVLLHTILYSDTLRLDKEEQECLFDLAYQFQQLERVDVIPELQQTTAA